MTKNIHSKFREYAPTLMGALGILGTFIGIIIGLLNFNTESIDTSIPVLLGGLKTAFITSIVGMFLPFYLMEWMLSFLPINEVR